MAIDRESATYTLCAEPELAISHWDEEITLVEGVPVHEDLPGAVTLVEVD